MEVKFGLLEDSEWTEKERQTDRERKREREKPWAGCLCSALLGTLGKNSWWALCEMRTKLHFAWIS